ncbi:hypothetical protein [Bradyrhizobium sp.]|uniref:hypothetical protein n=1 Tax=Bradyrhizobium sp. TaxID=376 RepID=UPI003C6F672E
MVELLFGISIILARRLALLARFRTAALLLAALLTRRLILAGLVLVRHVVSFHGNIMTTAQSRRPFRDKSSNAHLTPSYDGQPVPSLSSQFDVLVADARA